jgi:hypothetical protein
VWITSSRCPQVSSRNEDYRRIMRRLTPGPPTRSLSRNSADAAATNAAATAAAAGMDDSKWQRSWVQSPADAAAACRGRWDILTDHDHLVWVGDLNYRLELAKQLGPGANNKWPSPQVAVGHRVA